MTAKAPWLRHQDDIRFDRLERFLDFREDRKSDQFRQVESKAVDPVKPDQVDQTVPDQTPGHCGPATQIVAAAAPIHERGIRRQLEIIELVDDEQVIGLAHVVVDDIDEHRKAVAMKRLHQVPEFPDLGSALRVERITRFRRKIAHRHVTPVVLVATHIVEFLDGLQLHRVHSEPFEVELRVIHPFGEAGVAKTLRVRDQDGSVCHEIAHVGLDHDQILPLRCLEPFRGTRPAAHVEDNPRPLPVDGRQGIWIENVPFRIKATVFITRTIETEPIEPSVKIARNPGLPGAVGQGVEGIPDRVVRITELLEQTDPHPFRPGSEEPEDCLFT